MANKVIINTNKLFILNIKHFISYVFSGDVLPMTAMLAITAFIMPFSTLIYMFLMPILLLMAYKLAFDVLAETAQGNMSPKLRENYLVSNAIGVKVFIVAIIIEFVLWHMKRKGFDEQTRLYFSLFSAFITPAIYMSLAMTNSLIFSLNPLNLLKIIATMHISYGLLVLFWLATIALHEHYINPFIFNYLPIYLNGIISTFVEYTFLILNFHIMGYILFQYRRELDLEASGFNKIVSDQIAIDEVKSNPVYENIKKLLEEENIDRALAIIIQQQKEGDRSPSLVGLYKRAMDMKLYSPTNLDSANKIHRLLSDGLISKAFKNLMDYLDNENENENENEYIETSPDDINQLINYAVEINKTDFVALLVKDFHIKYPYHKDIVPNYFVLAKILYKDKETKQQSGMILKGLIEKYPKDEYMAEIKSWYKGLQLMSEKKPPF